MKLVSIPRDRYDEYRFRAMFDAYKWDPQFGDSNTLARHVLVLTPQEHGELAALTERLAAETVRAEALLNQDAALARPLALPRRLRGELAAMRGYRPEGHIRLMRFDFHPTAGGRWAVSEVNSDVPGGFAEASVLPRLAAGLLTGDGYRHDDFGDALAGAIARKTRPGGKVMLVHCTSYSDDRQVMQFLGDSLARRGLCPVYAAADHLRFEDKRAVSILDGNSGSVDAIFRFAPLEWLIRIRPRHWRGYFDTTTPSCNHPIAIFAQTKRFPLVWDALEERGVSLPTWRRLLPETREAGAAGEAGFVHKPACGRVGEGISIEEACREGEYERIVRDVKRRPRHYVAQRRFASEPLVSEEGERYHVCIGAFSVEGRACGYYARISAVPRIDSRAADIPVLVGECRL